MGHGAAIITKGGTRLGVVPLSPFPCANLAVAMAAALYSPLVPIQSLSACTNYDYERASENLVLAISFPSQRVSTVVTACTKLNLPLQCFKVACTQESH